MHLNRFGLNSIRKGEMLFNLEDVLVPLSFPTQIEVASKMIGGGLYHSRKETIRKQVPWYHRIQQSNAAVLFWSHISA